MMMRRRRRRRRRRSAEVGMEVELVGEDGVCQSA
jgi:hypothetical protein